MKIKKRHLAINLTFLIISALILAGCNGATNTPPANANQTGTTTSVIATENQNTSAVVTEKSTTAATTANSYITSEDAKDIALKHAEISAADANFKRSEYEVDDAIPHYEIEFTANGYEYDYDIHAESGKILDYDKEKIDY